MIRLDEMGEEEERIKSDHKFLLRIAEWYLFTGGVLGCNKLRVWFGPKF